LKFKKLGIGQVLMPKEGDFWWHVWAIPSALSLLSPLASFDSLATFLCGEEASSGKTALVALTSLALDFLSRGANLFLQFESPVITALCS
jgi:hypothetical protein